MTKITSGHSSDPFFTNPRKYKNQTGYLNTKVGPVTVVVAC